MTRAAKKLSTTHILLIALVGLVGLFSLTVKRDFYNSYNLLTMITNVTFLGLAAVGFCINLINGEVDISIGANIALTSCITAYFYEIGLHISICILAGLMVGVIIGVINALVITKFRVNSLIVTLGTMSIAQGVAYTITRGKSVLIMEDVLGFFGRGMVGPIPFPIFVLIIFGVLFHFLLNKTKFGQYVKAVGSNDKVAFLSGIIVTKIKFITILLAAVMASVAGLMVTSISAVGMPQHGIGQEFPIISAVILGGASLDGGKGSIVGSLVGILIMGVIYNGLVMLNIPSYAVEMIRGIILIAIVASYELRDRRRV